MFSRTPRAVAYIYWTLLIPCAWDDLINVTRHRLRTTARENGAAVSLQQSGAEWSVRDAALSKCKEIEQNGKDLATAGGVAVPPGWVEVDQGPEKTPTVFPIRSNGKRLLNLSVEAEKVWNCRVYLRLTWPIILCINVTSHHASGTAPPDASESSIQ